MTLSITGLGFDLSLWFSGRIDTSISPSGLSNADPTKTDGVHIMAEMFLSK